MGEEREKKVEVMVVEGLEVGRGSQEGVTAVSAGQMT